MPLVTSTGKSRIILGLMTFGPPGSEDSGARITSMDEYKQCLDYLQSNGYNEIDTARMYCGGKQEAFTRDVEWKNRGLTLATKAYPTQKDDFRPENLRKRFETSLKELGTDTVDIFYLHAPDPSVPLVETLEACNQFHKEGKFVQLGLSNYSAWEVAEAWNICDQRGWVKPTIYQAMYNAITRAIEPELIPACRRYNIDIVVYNPLAGGIFSGKYKSADLPTEGRFSNTSERLGNRYRDRYFKDDTFEALKLIEPVVQKHNLTVLETALRWLVHHSALKIKDGNDGVIIGVSSFKQLEDDVVDLEKGPLPDEVVEVLDKAWNNITKVSVQAYFRNGY